MKISLAKFDKIKKILKRLPRILGEQAFLTFLVLLFFSLIFGGLIFYKYLILAEKKEPEILEKPLFFKENLYQKVLAEWEEREKNFEQAKLKEYPNPFQEPIPEELTE